MVPHNTHSSFFCKCEAQPSVSSEGKVRAAAPGSHASLSGRTFAAVCWVCFTLRVWGKGVGSNEEPPRYPVYIVHEEYRSFAGWLFEVVLR